MLASLTANGLILPMIGLSLFSAFLLAAIVVMRLVETRRSVRRRAVAFNPASGFPHAGRPGDKPELEYLYAMEQGAGAGALATHSKLRGELVKAGLFSANAVSAYYALRLGLAVLFGLAVAVAVAYAAPESDLMQKLVFIAAGASLGSLIPNALIASRQRKMQRQCELGFPNFLDLMVICAEAGLPPRAALERVSREIARTHPYLGANLFLMHLQLRAGSTLAETAAMLGERTNVAEVRGFGRLLQQTEELGTNITTALRTYCDEMRVRRMLRAEEKAQGLPVKLIIPLATFVFPAMLVVVFLPLVLRARVIFM